MLVHDHCSPEAGTMSQQFEGQGTGDIIRDVGHTQVKVRQLSLHEICMDDLELVGIGGALDATLQLQNLQRSTVGFKVRKPKA